MTSPGAVPDEAFALGSALLWAISSTLYTAEGRFMRPAAMNAVKSVGATLVFGLIILAGALGPAGRAGPALFPDSANSVALIISGLIGISLGDTCYFESLARVGVRRTMMIGLLAPVFAAAAAALAGQPLPGLLGFTGILLTLGGILVVVRVAPIRGGPAAGAPGRHGVGRWGFGVMAALCQAIGIVMTKDAMTQGGIIPASLLRLLGGGLGVLGFEILRGRGSAIPEALRRGFSRPRLLLAMFLGTVVAFYLFQTAILLGSPPVTAALCATSPILVAPIAAHWLGERMPWTAALGTLLAVGGVVLVALD